MSDELPEGWREVTLREIAGRRSGRPLLLVDLGVPRNFAAGVQGLDGTYLCDLDDLARVSNANLKARLAEVDRARIALAEKAARAWGAANHQASPEA